MEVLIVSPLVGKFDVVFGLAGPEVGLGRGYFSLPLTIESLSHPMHSTNLQYI
jgi:hypothetical protein